MDSWVWTKHIPFCSGYSVAYYKPLRDVSKLQQEWHSPIK